MKLVPFFLVTKFSFTINVPKCLKSDVILFFLLLRFLFTIKRLRCTKQYYYCKLTTSVPSPPQGVAYVSTEKSHVSGELSAMSRRNQRTEHRRRRRRRPPPPPPFTLYSPPHCTDESHPADAIFKVVPLSPLVTLKVMEV